MRHRKRKSLPVSRPARKRSNSRVDRPTLREALIGANARAHARANRRAGKRRGLTSVQAAIDGIPISDVGDFGWSKRLSRWLLALLMLPFCIITTRAMFLSDADGILRWIDLLRSQEFIYFAVGMFWMAGWFFTGIGERFFLYLYVLGHEVTHAIFIHLCFGKVGRIHVTADGGYVMTNKTNALIALSPYFIPLWSVVVLLVSTLVSLLIEVPYHDQALYFLLGVTWAFHLLWTVWMIPRDQPDLKENGIFFSLVLIYLVNAALFYIILCSAPVYTWRLTTTIICSRLIQNGHGQPNNVSHQDTVTYLTRKLQS